MNNRMNAQPLPIGLAYIGGFVNKELHSVRLLDLMFSEDYNADVINAIKTFAPDVIGISLRNLSNHSYIDTRWAVPITQQVITTIKKVSQARVIVGGPGFSTLPVPCYEYVGADFGLVGDSGEAFNALISDIEADELDPTAYQGLVYTDSNETRYDGSVCTSSFTPTPYYEGLNLDLYNKAGFGIGVVTKLTSWQYGSGSLRVSKSPEDIISELKTLSRLENFKKVFFIDNAFNVPSKDAEVLCEALIHARLGLHWSTVLSPSNPDSQLIKLMKEAGCVFSLITADDALTADDDSIYKICTREKLGFGLNVGFGGIGESEDSVNKKLKFLSEANATISYLRYGVSVMPGTAESEALLQSGRINDEKELIKPHFYVDPAVEPWLLAKLKEMSALHPKWNLT
ncbi:MAG: Tryptophan 2-C-methyltransferase [Chloroflexota bacterium]|jgi:radical SAM superfamily enzyme YgiQ (UPF0313 family)|nr:MAG: Tryptophan 2-C-methyltransferase [Chloroflexota bacterium]